MKSSEHQLNESLRALAEAAPRSAPAELEITLRQAFRNKQRSRLVRRRVIPAGMGAVAAGLLLFASLRTPGVMHPTSSDHAIADFAGLTPLPDADPLEPDESAAIMRVQLTLDSDSVDEGGPAETVEAEVLVGEDGRAHAVRFLP